MHSRLQCSSPPRRPLALACRIEGVQQKSRHFFSPIISAITSAIRRLSNIAEGDPQHIAEQNMVEMDVGLDRHVQHQPGAKHAEKTIPIMVSRLRRLLSSRKPVCYGAQQPGDVRRWRRELIM